MKEIKRILVGVDGSENAMRAVEMAAQLAKRYDAKVTLAHVVAPSDHAVVSGKATYMDKDTKVGGVSLKAAEEIMAKNMTVYESTVEFGDPAELLLGLSRKHDIVVVGTRGLSPLQELIVGSVSGRLIQFSKVPVVVVP